MEDLTKDMGKLYLPYKALVLFKTNDTQIHVQLFDLNTEGSPTSSRQLSPEEANKIAEALTNQDGQ